MFKVINKTNTRIGMLVFIGFLATLVACGAPDDRRGRDNRDNGIPLNQPCQEHQDCQSRYCSYAPGSRTMTCLPNPNGNNNGQNNRNNGGYNNGNNRNNGGYNNGNNRNNGGYNNGNNRNNGGYNNGNNGRNNNNGGYNNGNNGNNGGKNNGNNGNNPPSSSKNPPNTNNGLACSKADITKMAKCIQNCNDDSQCRNKCFQQLPPTCLTCLNTEAGKLSQMCEGTTGNEKTTCFRKALGLMYKTCSGINPLPEASEPPRNAKTCSEIEAIKVSRCVQTSCEQGSDINQCIYSCMEQQANTSCADCQKWAWKKTMEVCGSIVSDACFATIFKPLRRKCIK